MESGGLVIILVFGFAAIIVFAIVQSSNAAKKDEERGSLLKQSVQSIPNFIESVSVTGIKNMYKFAVDNQHKKILYVCGTSKMIIPFDKIMGVSIDEDNKTILSKSSMRTIGGAIVGGAIAGSAGTVVGGLSGDSTLKKKVSKVKVIIKLRDLNNSSIAINCFNSTTMTVEHSSEIKTDGKDGSLYKQGLQHAQKIVDLVSIIIDQTDKEQKSMSTKSQSNVSTSSTIEELEKLANLKEKGILTEEEFNQQKKLLLERGSETSSLVEPVMEESSIEIVGTVIPPEVQEAIDRGDKYKAVEIYKNSVGCSLSEAMEFIEQYF